VYRVAEAADVVVTADTERIVIVGIVNAVVMEIGSRW
jgi:hypothetical protein